MRKYIGHIGLVLSLIAITMSMVALCHICPRDLYLGWIIGILALLVTFLLGWNIYSMIDIKENHKSYLAIINEVDISQHKVLSIQEYTNWMIYHQLLLGKDPISLEYRFLYHAVNCFYHTSYIGDIQICEIITKGICECLASPKNIRMKENNKADLLSVMQKVRNKKQIRGYSEALSKILLIRTA